MAHWGVGVTRGANMRGVLGMGLAQTPTQRLGYGGAAELMDMQLTCLRLCWQLNWNRKLAL